MALAFAIRGQMRQLAKSHVKLDSRLQKHHDSYPCPICYPIKSISREQEDKEWEAFRHSQSCLSNKLGMWVSRPRKETEVPKESNDIVVVDEPMETTVLDISKLTDRQRNIMSEKKDVKPKDMTTDNLVNDIISLQNAVDPKSKKQLQVLTDEYIVNRAKGTGKQRRRKLRKVIKRLGKS